MADALKHIGRTALKTVIPIGGKPLADVLMPLGMDTFVDQQIKGYDPMSAYDTTSRNNDYGSRIIGQSTRQEKIQAPGEDIVAGGIQSLAIAGAGIATGNPMLAKKGIELGIKRGVQTLSRVGNPNEKTALEDATQWASLALSELKNNKFKKGNSPIGTDTKIGKIGSGSDMLIQDTGNVLRTNNFDDILKNIGNTSTTPLTF